MTTATLRVPTVLDGPWQTWVTVVDGLSFKLDTVTPSLSLLLCRHTSLSCTNCDVPWRIVTSNNRIYLSKGPQQNTSWIPMWSRRKGGLVPMFYRPVVITCLSTIGMKSVKLVSPSRFISWKKTPSDAVTRVVTIHRNLYHDNRSFKYHDNWIITILEFLCLLIPKPNFCLTNCTSVRNCQGQFQVCNMVPFKMAQIVGI